MKLPGVKVGDVFGVVGSASVRIGNRSSLDKSVFAWVRRVFVRDRVGPQNPSIYDHASSSLAPGTPFLPTTYSKKLSRPPQNSPSPTGNFSGKSLQNPPDLYANSLIFTAWRFGA